MPILSWSPRPNSSTSLAEGSRGSFVYEPGVPGSKALLKRLVRAEDARGRSGDWVTRKLSHHGPVVVSGQWVAGASFSGRRRALPRGPGRGVQAVQGIQRGCHCCTRTLLPASLFPYSPLRKPPSGQGSRPAGWVSTLGPRGRRTECSPHRRPRVHRAVPRVQWE